MLDISYRYPFLPAKSVAISLLALVDTKFPAVVLLFKWFFKLLDVPLGLKTESNTTSGVTVERSPLSYIE